MPQLELKSSPLLSASLSMNRRPSQVLDVTPVNELDLHDLMQIDFGGDGSTADVSEVVKFLNHSGFDELNSDARLDPIWQSLKDMPDGFLTCPELTGLKRNNLLVQKALSGDLAISDFRLFSDIVTKIYGESKSVNSGAVASYIPQLASVDPNLFGVSICTVDGQRFSIGDSAQIFSVQSVSKVVTYSIALETNGIAKVHEHVGMEPSGRNFNERVLLPSGIPHNPLINTGAIMCSSLLFKDEPRWKRFEKVADYWRRLSGSPTNPSILQSTFLAERETANRNFCLAHMMAETPGGLFPSDLKAIQTVLDDYFSYCSLGVTTESMSVVAATYANGGLNPITDERVLRPETVTASLSVMMSCGMYDASGEFSSVNGFPAKSGVSGIIMAVIPGVCGICTYSPQIDPLGNSTRGLDFFFRLAREVMKAPLYKSPSMQGSITTAFGNQFDWRTSGKESVLKKFGIREFSSLWWSASGGDELRIRQLAARGIDVNESNYSNRNALNFAINKTNNLSTVKLLIDLKANLGDEYFSSYIEDAKMHGRDDIIALLERERDASPRAISQSFDFVSPTKIPVGRFFTGMKDGDLVTALDDAGLYYEPSEGSLQHLYVRALCGKLIIPNWPKFVDQLITSFRAASRISEDDDVLSLAVTSSDSQRIHLTTDKAGVVVRVPRESEKVMFPIDAIVRVVLYEIAVAELTSDRIHQFIGKEPSGQPETSLRMNSEGLPYNPLTMGGCLMVCHLLLQRLSMAEVMTRIRDRLGGNTSRSTNPEIASIVDDRRYGELCKCVLHLLSAGDDSGDIMTSSPLTLELFNNAHSLQVDLPTLSDYARSVAAQPIATTDSSSILALLYSCGLDEVSGEWSFRFGLPAKTSLSGTVLVVVPGVLGFAMKTSRVSLQPLPDTIFKFLKRFDFKFNFHLFKRHFSSVESTDPTLFFGSDKLLLITQFISAAFHGDLSTMKHLVAEGLDVNCTDMDGRTALHIANGVGNAAVGEWLVSVGANQRARDQWGMTPLFEIEDGEW